ncbi:MAG: tetratricopeptide repeat protein, partial [Thermoanaerobaculia bacterium]
SILAIGGVFLLGLAAGAALRRPGLPASLGLLFFLVAMLPASNLLFPIGTIFAERVTYLPSAGICLILGAALTGSEESIGRVPPARLATLAAAVLLLSARTAMRATVWSSDERLFENSVRVAPGSAKNHYNLGSVRAGLSRWREGLAAYTRATEIYPKYWDAWASKGRCERALGRLGAARSSYERSLEAQPGYENGFFGLGQVLEERGEDRGALEIYRRGLGKNPRSLSLALRVAVLESRLAEPSAGRSWRRILADHPGSLPARLGYAGWLRERGETEAARRELARMLAAAPRYEPALRKFAEMDTAAGRFFGAALARERIFRTTRGTGDLLLLCEAAGRDTAYRLRFERLRPRLERAAPWAFRYAGACGGSLTTGCPSASPASDAGG